VRFRFVVDEPMKDGAAAEQRVRELAS